MKGGKGVAADVTVHGGDFHEHDEFTESPSKVVVAKEAAELEKLQNRLSVRDLATEFESGQAVAKAAAAKLAEEEVITDTLQGHNGCQLFKYVYQDLIFLCDRSCAFLLKNWSRSGSISSPVLIWNVHCCKWSLQKTCSPAKEAKDSKRRSSGGHQCRHSHGHGHSHGNSPGETVTKSPGEGSPFFRTSLRRTSGNIRECEKVSSLVSPVASVLAREFNYCNYHHRRIVSAPTDKKSPIRTGLGTNLIVSPVFV